MNIYYDKLSISNKCNKMRLRGTNSASVIRRPDVMERRIAKVENCHEKQETYQEQMRRYSKAIKECFYY